MKKIFTTSLIALFFLAALSAQQSLQLEYGISQGTQKPAGSLSLSWYRNDALYSGYVMRMNYDKSKSDNENEIMSRSIQMDVAKRWHSLQDEKLKMYFEGGISGMVMNSQNKEIGVNNVDCIYCLTSDVIQPILTEENSTFLYDYKDRSYGLNLMPGATMGAGVDRSIGKRFYIGFQLRLNTYYWIGGNELLYYLRYGLNAGFYF